MLKAIKRVSLTDKIMEQILGHIRTDIRAGEKIMSERELIEKLGVGRSSLREAMRALEAMGIVETPPAKERSWRSIAGSVSRNISNGASSPPRRLYLIYMKQDG